MSLQTNQPATCEHECDCTLHQGSKTGLIVLTGGPGAGKTAVLEIIRKQLCEHVVILPEAASVVFGGGFWRLPSKSARLASQHAILHVQQQSENLVLGEQKWAIGLCDRGTLDGLAYWPDDENSFWDAAQSDLQREYDRYQAVIHLRTPTEDFGYNHHNPLRIETAVQAEAIDNKIAIVWSGHPHYHVVESTADFLVKAEMALEHIKKYIPDCCRVSAHL